MVLKILAEVALSVTTFGAGGIWWQLWKRGKFLKKIVKNEILLKSLISEDALANPPIQLLPYVAKNEIGYFVNIDVVLRADQTSQRIPKLVATVALLLVLAASVVLGSTCLLINLGIFLLVGFVPIMESAKQNADEQILTLGVILYKWRSENALECDEFVARAHSLRKLYDAVLRATGQPRKEELVFAYGSNMDLEQMRERCPGSDLRPFVAEARGWRLCFPRRANKRRGGVGSVIRHLGESVWGVVFRVTPEDLRTLDKREGVFIDAYHRERIEVFSVDGKSYDVWTYFAVPQDSPARDYTPHRDYISLYLRGAEQFKLPPEYQEKLRKIETSNT